MNGLDLIGLGTFLLGVAAVISSIAAWRSGKKITAIDHAVNGKPAGAQTMQSQVSDIHSDRPAPLRADPELNDAAIRDMLRELVAESRERRQN